MNENILKTILLEQAQQLTDKDLGVEREALTVIKSQLKTPSAIVISGLRRVGKSTLLAQIAKRFYASGQYYFVNFEDERFLDFKAEDFNELYEMLIRLFGLRKVFLLDEIQNVRGWERFVRRMIDEGNKFFITGSNASLLSHELGTKLTGRYWPLELFPFSFKEFLLFKKYKFPKQRFLTKEKGRLGNFFDDYLRYGGIPDSLKYPKGDWQKVLYEDIIYRDVAARYHISELRALKELTFYLISNVATLISFNKLKESLKLGSVNTVKSYIDYLMSSWLLFTVNQYAFSVKKQQIANKKVYGIDTGMISAVAFSFSQNKGKLLENLVFLTLRRVNKEIYYYRTQKGLEVDFFLPRKKFLLQVCLEMENPKVWEREIGALIQAMTETKIKEGMILTQGKEEDIKIDGKKIKIVSLVDWFLNIKKK